MPANDGTQDLSKATPVTQSLSNEAPKGLDEALRMFADYVKGEGDFDELDFKEWLIEVWTKSLTFQAARPRRNKNGYNAKGWKV